MNASKDNLSYTPKPLNPNIPIIDMEKVFEVKLKEENENESESLESEEEEEEDILSENAKLLPSGSMLSSNASLTRKGSLLQRKEEVIDLLNTVYENEESKHFSDMKSFENMDTLNNAVSETHNKSSERELNSNPLESDIEDVNIESSKIDENMKNTSVYRSNTSFEGSNPNI